MKLLELLVQEKVQWPDGALWAMQDFDRELKFADTDESPKCPVPSSYVDVWCRVGYHNFDSRYLTVRASDWDTKAVSKQEYDAAMAANAEWGPVKWGDWKVGDELRFDGYTQKGEKHTHWGWVVGSTYVVSLHYDGKRSGPTIYDEVPTADYGFKFSKRKANSPAPATVPSAVVTTPVCDWYAELAPVIAAAAEGKVVQYLAADGNWYTSQGAFMHPNKYRVKPEEPKTIKVNGFDVPEPMQSAPLEDGQYYVAAPGDVNWYWAQSWYGFNSEQTWVSRGLVHSSREAAIAHAKAMLGIDPYATEDTDDEHA